MPEILAILFHTHPGILDLFFLTWQVAAQSSRKLSDSIHALGERHCLATRKDFAANTASLTVNKIAGIAGMMLEWLSDCQSSKKSL